MFPGGQRSCLSAAYRVSGDNRSRSVQDGSANRRAVLVRISTQKKGDEKIAELTSIEQKLQDLEEMFRRTGKYNLKVADFIALMRKHGRIIDVGLSGALEINYEEIGKYINFMKTKENEVIRILDQLKKVNSQFDS